MQNPPDHALDEDHGRVGMELSVPLGDSDGYRQLLQQISDTYTEGRVRAVQAVNAQLLETYWQVGRHIVEFEQAGQTRAAYGAALIQTLAADLGLRARPADARRGTRPRRGSRWKAPAALARRRR